MMSFIFCNLVVSILIFLASATEQNHGSDACKNLPLGFVTEIHSDLDQETLALDMQERFLTKRYGNSASGFFQVLRDTIGLRNFTNQVNTVRPDNGVPGFGLNMSLKGGEFIIEGKIIRGNVSVNLDFSKDFLFIEHQCCAENPEEQDLLCDHLSKGFGQESSLIKCFYAQDQLPGIRCDGTGERRIDQVCPKNDFRIIRVPIVSNSLDIRKDLFESVIVPRYNTTDGAILTEIEFVPNKSYNDYEAEFINASHAFVGTWYSGEGREGDRTFKWKYGLEFGVDVSIKVEALRDAVEVQICNCDVFEPKPQLNSFCKELEREILSKEAERIKCLFEENCD